MTSRPHDALFKSAFEVPEHAAGIFRELLPASVCQAIAWDSMAPEAGSFIDPDLADHHSDLLFSVRLRDDGQRAFVYLLLEHQSSNDADMPLRVLGYLLRIWERFRKEHPGTRLPPIIPAIVSHVPGGWTAPRSLDDLFDPHPSSIPGFDALLPRFSLLIEDLAHLSNEDLKARALTAFPKLALWALRDARDTERLLDNLGYWASAFHEARRTPSGILSLAQLVRYIALVTDEMHFDMFRAKLREVEAPKAKEIVMTIAERLRHEGRVEGIVEGRVEGHVEGRVQVLRRLLAIKFGAVGDEFEARIVGATPDQLDHLLERVLMADSLAAVFAKS
jgi:predicted transposase/invertase (TIGR01784 family)